MNAGIVQISLGVLKHILKLPEEVKLLKVRQSWEQEREGKFEVLVESPNLLPTLRDNKYPWVTIKLETEFCREDEITHIVRGSVENY